MTAALRWLIVGLILAAVAGAMPGPEASSSGAFFLLIAGAAMGQGIRRAAKALF